MMEEYTDVFFLKKGRVKVCTKVYEHHIVIMIMMIIVIPLTNLYVSVCVCVIQARLFLQLQRSLGSMHSHDRNTRFCTRDSALRMVYIFAVGYGLDPACAHIGVTYFCESKHIYIHKKFKQKNCFFFSNYIITMLN